MRPRIAIAVVTLAAAAACGGADAPANSAAIEGRVTAGPVCPVETEASPCPDVPIEATVTARAAGSKGGRTFTATAGADGRFRIVTGEGTFVLEAQSARAMSCDSVRVDVRSAVVRADISCDTGIR